jgi:hypothetical protein
MIRETATENAFEPVMGGDIVAAKEEHRGEWDLDEAVVVRQWSAAPFASQASI